MVASEKGWPIMAGRKTRAWVLFLAVGVGCSTAAIMPDQGLADEPLPSLTREQASAFARLALKGINKEYPNKPEHVVAGPADVKSPKALHPAFYGCYDWHSSVHGHWMLVRLLRLFPDLPEAGEIRTILGAHLTAENVKAEADYFAQGEQVVRAAVRMGLAAQAGRGAARLGQPGRAGVVQECSSARRHGGGAIRGILSEADLPHPDRRPPEYRVRTLVRT